MKILAILITTLLLMQSTASAEKPGRLLMLTDWHMAGMYVYSNRSSGRTDHNVDAIKMLKANYCGELYFTGMVNAFKEAGYSRLLPKLHLAIERAKLSRNEMWMNSQRSETVTKFYKLLIHKR